uniref:ATP-dependent zinc metalloprotease FtsH n=1 Tax=Eustigmatophyceae sp. Chic 10/23 P-6w TaxID=1446905 RepID=A0A3R5QMX2_9STRA|nr:cell division protein FTSH [Eustigmatophyceae sp. Chic 10/23 P-6w]QAA11504.1 cell division protein FTSH [Eustigmatophyceae sp. Chic 10/23 P-6w]
MIISFIDQGFSGSNILLSANEVKSANTSPTAIVTYGRFLEYLDNGWVQKVDLYNNAKFAIFEASLPDSADRVERLGVNIPNKDVKLIRKLKEANIDLDVHAADATSKNFEFPSLLWVPIGIVGFIIISGLIMTLFEDNQGSGRSRNGGGIFNPFSSFDFRQFFQAPGRFERAPVTKVGFDDVAGIDEVKEEFQEIVSFLKKPERYTRVGARIPKGVLLSGPPGTGKTLLAKAIAGEAKVPFLSCSASEFVELFVGIGASRIRDLFRRAKANTPCIVFIDEIDAVGRQRGAGIGGGNDEREQTLNQLLTEMDGFETNNGVIVIAATNRVDILDSALLRPGRFDRQLVVGLPDYKSRLAILKVHARNKKLSKEVLLETVAKRTPGFSGADLANLLNEAAILTARYSEKETTMKRVNEALDKVTGGIQAPPLEETRSKRLLAYHEIGHALTASLLEYHDPVDTVSLIPRGRKRSSTTYIPSEETLFSRNQLLTRMITLMAGRAAEEIVFGKAEVTTVAVDDIQLATYIARQMVTEFGMSPLGPVAFRQSQPQDAFMRSGGQAYSNQLAFLIDTNIRILVYYAFMEALTIVRQNRDLITKLANKILQKETIDGFEIRSLLYQTKTISVSQSENLKLEPVIPFDELLLDRVEKLINSAKYSTKLASVSSAEEEENLLDELLDEACAYLMILKQDNSEEYGRQINQTKAAKNRLALSSTFSRD